MTKAQLNNKVKRLLKEYKALDYKNTDEYFDKVDNVLKPLFTEIYRADTSMGLLTKESILIMFRLNLKFRWEPLHSFGIFINL